MHFSCWGSMIRIWLSLSTLWFTKSRQEDLNSLVDSIFRDLLSRGDVSRNNQVVSQTSRASIQEFQAQETTSVLTR